MRNETAALRKILTANFQESFCACWMPVMNWLKSARLGKRFGVRPIRFLAS
jgi:hypothetical protein